MMLYKLLKYGITGQVYRMIKSIYNRTEYSVQINDECSPLFQGDNGLKQGCCLSPTLSNIFQNDLHEIFDESCDPLQVGNIKLNSMSWADDLMIASLSSEGLQLCLNKLSRYCKKWGLEVNVEKTKTMTFSKRFTQTEPVYLNGTEIESVKTMNYLGFEISFNGSIKIMITDRIKKATKVAHMVLQALRTNRNVSAALAISIFDKQIAPILLYGCAIWSMPKSQNLIYIEDQPENITTRLLTNRIFYDMLGRNVRFDYARRVGKVDLNGKRKILVKLKYFTDKESLMCIQNSTYRLSNFSDQNYSEITKMQLDYCKKSLNLSKYSSNFAIQGELGVLPIEHRAYCLTVKYWLRLYHKTKNVLLNEMFDEVKNDQYQWLQSIQASLCTNGFGDVWINPGSVNPENFHKVFRQRLDDQYIQAWRNKIDNSTRFHVLSTLSSNESTYSRSKYIDKIKNPSVREIFTRLRVDMSVLASSVANLNDRNPEGICVHCTSNDVETPEHFLFHCTKYVNERQSFYENIMVNDTDIKDIPIIQRIKYVLDLQCPSEQIGTVCSYVCRIYSLREQLGASS